jgi:hypothetical protein
MVLFGHCFGVMLHGLIMQKPKIKFKINAQSVGSPKQQHVITNNNTHHICVVPACLWARCSG